MFANNGRNTCISINMKPSTCKLFLFVNRGSDGICLFLILWWVIILYYYIVLLYCYYMTLYFRWNWGSDGFTVRMQLYHILWSFWSHLLLMDCEMCRKMWEEENTQIQSQRRNRSKWPHMKTNEPIQKSCKNNDHHTFKIYLIFDLLSMHAIISLILI